MERSIKGAYNSVTYASYNSGQMWRLKYKNDSDSSMNRLSRIALFPRFFTQNQLLELLGLLRYFRESSKTQIFPTHYSH